MILCKVWMKDDMNSGTYSIIDVVYLSSSSLFFPTIRQLTFGFSGGVR